MPYISRRISGLKPEQGIRESIRVSSFKSPAERENEILRIFSSFGVGEGKLDPQLIGTWRLSSTHAIQNF